MAEWALIITAIGTAMASVIAATASLMAVVKGREIHNEVKTMNELTLGQLGERRETRRIDAVDPDDRTAQERRHLAMAELDPHTRGVEKSIKDRKAGGEPGTAKLDDTANVEPE